MNPRPFRRRLAIRFAKLVRGCISTCRCSVWPPSSSSAPPASRSTTPTGSSARPSGAPDPKGTSIGSGCTSTSPKPDPTPDEAPDLARQVNKLEVVESLRKAHGIRGALADFKVDESECTVTFKGPGYAADAFIDRDTGHYTLTQSFHGLIAVLNDLHKGRDTGLVWSILIDASAIVLTVISLSGLVLLFYLKLRRIPGLLVVLAGTVVVAALFYLGVP